jgi:benzoyl-CoA reductase/2-hydroxyglutaryl-CoA dehydratase subunit BcrC/BadD/HgdB
VTAFDKMQKHYRQRDIAAREWKKKGGKVVGYFCDIVPEELILAAGLFPLRITGKPGGSTEVIDKYLEPFYEDFVRTELNMLLTGEYTFVDYLVIPRTKDSITQQYSHLAQIQAFDPSIKLSTMYLYEFLHTRSYASEFYNRDRMLDLKKKLEEWSGKKITKKALARAIAITNENKTLLKKVAELRVADPPRISGVQALQIIGSSMFMLKEDHNKLLREYLDGIDKLPARSGTRLFVEASPLDTVQFYEIVESCQATVVAEDHCWGNRYAEVPIDTSLDPMEAIVKRYYLKSPCPYVYQVGVRSNYCLQRVLESKAQGVIFNIYDWDPSQIWDYPEQKKLLEAKGIPTLRLMEQKHLIPDASPIKTSIEKFIGTIK